MNIIKKYDFENLFGDLQCVPFQMLATNESQENDEEEEQSIIPTSLNQNFAISVVNEQSSELPNSERSIQPRRVTVKKADFNGKHEENVKLASLVN